MVLTKRAEEEGRRVTHVSHSRLMTGLQLRWVPERPLRQAFLKASLERKTRVEYNSVSLKVKTRSGR